MEQSEKAEAQGGGQNTAAATTSRPQRMKRKMGEENHNSTRGSKPVKRARGKRGLLKNFVEMPMDVLYEIFCELDPLDLLNIARTTKDLRAILMTRSSIFIWKTARSHVVGLPDCPDDLNEPQYATLMFVTRCSFCQKNLSIIHISWNARVKCCNKCLKLNFTPAPEMDPDWDYDWEGYPDLLVKWVPRIQITHKTYSRAPGAPTERERVLIIRKVAEQWETDYRALPDPKSKYDWCIRTLEERIAISNHARACSLWYDARQAGTSDVEIKEILERYAIFMDYIKEIGLEQELSHVPPTEDSLDLLGIKDIICQSSGPLEESDLFDLEEMFTKKLTTVGQDHEALIYRELYSGRERVLEKIHRNAVERFPLNTPEPSLATVYRIAEAHNLMDYSKSNEDASRVPFDEIVALWRRRVDDKMIELIVDAYGPEYVFDPATVLDLATTVFFCGSRDDPPMRREQTTAHFCAFGLYNDKLSRPSKKEFIRIFRPGCRSNKVRHVCVEFRVDISKAIGRIVEICGLDLKVTTARQMDELDPIFECRTCSSAEKGRMMMTWTRALGHPCARRPKSIKTRTFRRLDEPEESQVRQCIRKEQKRATLQSKHCFIMCPHCKSCDSSFLQHQQHLQVEHEISEVPTYEELIYSIDEDRTPPSYRFFSQK